MENHLGNISIQATNMGSYTSTYAYENSKIYTYAPQSSDLTVGLQYDQPDSDSEGWLNKLVLNGRAIFSMTGVDELDFRDAESRGFGKIVRYRLANGSGSLIWEITDPSSPQNIPYTLSGSDAFSPWMPV